MDPAREPKSQCAYQRLRVLLIQYTFEKSRPRQRSFDAIIEPYVYALLSLLDPMVVDADARAPRGLFGDGPLAQERGLEVHPGRWEVQLEDRPLGNSLVCRWRKPGPIQK